MIEIEMNMAIICQCFGHTHPSRPGSSLRCNGSHWWHVDTRRYGRLCTHRGPTLWWPRRSIAKRACDSVPAGLLLTCCDLQPSQVNTTPRATHIKNRIGTFPVFPDRLFVFPRPISASPCDPIPQLPISTVNFQWMGFFRFFLFLPRLPDLFQRRASPELRAEIELIGFRRVRVGVNRITHETKPKKKKPKLLAMNKIFPNCHVGTTSLKSISHSGRCQHLFQPPIELNSSSGASD